MSDSPTTNATPATKATTGHQAWGWALQTQHDAGTILDAWFPDPRLGAPDDSDHAPGPLSTAETRDDERLVNLTTIKVVIDLDEPPASTPDAYLRLHLLSHRLVQPRSINLDGIFAQLPNVVWTSAGPCAVEGFELVRLGLRNRHGQLAVYGVDKFPRMTDYVVPSGVRIADADRVRLGAHLAPGTTVMHEGFCNFNAGTLGASMVEGRISQGVVVGDGTDIGGGASIMGTLSGGGSEMVSIGRGCLLGAESGLAISLGDNCVLEAGLYLTAGTKVALASGEVVRAATLSGRSDLLFLRHSQTGQVLALDRANQAVELNAALHANG